MREDIKDCIENIKINRDGLKNCEEKRSLKHAEYDKESKDDKLEDIEKGDGGSAMTESGEFREEQRGNHGCRHA
jgi:hypothetical protein